MAGVSAKVEVDGLNDALRTLRYIDPQLRRQVDKQMKETVGKDIVPFARRLYPADDRVGNWGRWPRGTGYRQASVRRGVKLRIKTTGRQDQISGLFLTNSNGPGVIFSTAGKKTSGTAPTRTDNGSGNSAAFIDRLKRFGEPMRALWPAVLEKRDTLESNVNKAVDDLMKTINKELR
jgi:hypothetical protein